ncbi:MAG: hypothetical protein CVU07_08895, partial [Bacteroidetes bacterium HGW-Bacteroidetes-23]
MTNVITTVKKGIRPWYYIFRYMSWRDNIKNKKQGCINLRLGENHASRNVYFFVKALHAAGYQVYPCTDRSFINRILKDHYATFILTEGLLHFAIKPQKKCITIGIVQKSDVHVSYDYFSSPPLPEGESPKVLYHVPIGMHPLQYHLKVDQLSFNLRRNKALFFSGNIKPKFYKNFDFPNFFDMPSRLELIEKLKTSDLPIKLNPKVETLTTNIWDQSVVICDSDCCKVPHEDWRKTLAGMTFFMCFPGQHIPFCHNIYEAMSVGTIPILHQRYADLFSPALQNNINCLTYSSTDDFISVCQKALQTDANTLDRLHRSVLDYYHAHLTPEAVGKRITDNQVQTIYLQAEQY